MKKNKKIKPSLLGTREISIVLGVVCAGTLAIRLLPFPTVFGGTFVNFLEPDAYNRMDIAKQLVAMGPFNALNYTFHNSTLFSLLVAWGSLVSPLELVGAWLPPLLAVGTVIVVYHIGATLFNQKVGLFASIFTSIIPSEFLHRSLLGLSDHHVLEVFLMALIFLALIKQFKCPKLFNLFTFISVVGLLLYMLNWNSGVYLMGGIFILFVCGMFIFNLITHQKWHTSIPLLVVPMVLSLMLYLPLGGWDKFAFLFPGDTSVSGQTTGEIIGTVTSALSTRTISELMPLLAPMGTFSLAVVVTNLHWFALFFLLALPFFWFYRKDKAVWLLLIWTLVILIITLNQRRFLYYLTLNVALFASFVIYEIGIRLRGPTVRNMVIIAMLPILASIPGVRNITSTIQPFKMPEEWHTALVWLNTQPGDGNVTAWGDYGHWIKYVTGKTPNYLPGPGGENVARLFLSADPVESQKLLKVMNTQYLIIDQPTLENKYFALFINSGLPVQPDKNKAFAYNVFYNNAVPDYLKLVWQGPTIRIYETK
jgi:asparagine N-glycosylation enzyme membrane subunit Stt3